MGRASVPSNPALTLLCGAALLLFPARSQDSHDQILALVNGEPITQKRLNEEIRPQLAQLEQQILRLRESMLVRLIDNLLLEQAARRENLTVEEFLARRLQFAAVSDEEVEAAWLRSRERFPGALAAEAKYRIRRNLEDQRRAEAFRRLLEDLRRQSTIVNYLNRQAAGELAADPGPRLGPAEAAVEVVEFADFECPFCRKAQAVVRRALARWEGRIRHVFRHFPLPNHPHAFPAAVAAACAERQGRFWEYRQALFEYDGPLSDAALLSLAEARGLSGAEFAACLKDPAAAERVRRDIKLGRKAGVSGTPTFFVNGRRVSDFTQLEAAIEEAFRHGQASR
ncbi:MAG: thioredoxin domain-containing protein [Bryobacterales bacterium]|nr:thioredoxin domain-containing protein [Bryobacteraceae bacterium]MDW8355062.1 thioredoxin domain-containing protein [Bryobacterales bacterium]